MRVKIGDPRTHDVGHKRDAKVSRCINNPVHKDHSPDVAWGQGFIGDGRSSSLGWSPGVRHIQARWLKVAEPSEIQLVAVQMRLDLDAYWTR